MSRFFLVQAAVVLLTPALAMADEDPSDDFALYVRGSVAASFFHSFDHELIIDFDTVPSVPVGTVPRQELNLSPGISPAAAVGLNLRGPFRVELEYRHLNNGIDEVLRDGVSASFLGDPGKITAHVAMANFAYSFETVGPFKPYAAIGAGAARFRNEFDFPDNAGALPGRNEWVFAYQARVGVEREIFERVSIGLDYTFLGAADPDFDARESGVIFDGRAARVSLISLSFTKKF